MGENKALKLFGGEPLIARMVARVQSIAQELLVTTNQPQAFEFLGDPTGGRPAAWNGGTKRIYILRLPQPGNLS